MCPMNTPSVGVYFYFGANYSGNWLSLRHSGSFSHHLNHFPSWTDIYNGASGAWGHGHYAGTMYCSQDAPRWEHIHFGANGNWRYENDAGSFCYTLASRPLWSDISSGASGRWWDGRPAGTFSCNLAFHPSRPGPSVGAVVVTMRTNGKVVPSPAIYALFLREQMFTLGR